MRFTAWFTAAGMACGGVSDLDSAVGQDALERESPAVTLPEPTLRRLTREQYGNALTDLLGDGLVLPSSLEPDQVTDGLKAIGASLTTISPRGVEQYEEAAFGLVEQALAREANRAMLVPCDLDEEGCTEDLISAFARRAWRRPVQDDELDVLVAIAEQAEAALGQVDDGITYALATVLQSPNFLFRVELGQAAPDGSGVWFTDHEMAGRMSFLLWNTIPDEELLRAADDGELTTEEGLRVQLDRMIDDPRYEDGVRAFFTDMWTLYELDDLTKDPTVFTHMSPEVGESAREETLLSVVQNVVHDEGDYREMFTTTRTYLDRKLASIYNVRAPAREGFGLAYLPPEGGRRGVLGHASFLALQSHAVNSSATLRGKFVREVMLCQYIPPPPSDVDTSIPEASADAVTLRERVAVHLEDPFCASCHQLVDPIGLGFEQFDGLGHFRTLEDGATIDPSGDIDGEGFADAWEMAQVLSEHDRLPRCLAQTALAYASGHSITDGEQDAVGFLDKGFRFYGHSVTFLLRDIVMSEAFRRAGEIE